MLTTSYRDSILDTLRGTTLTSWTGFVGLIKAITDFRAGTVTEAAYTGYGTRPSATFSAPANTSPVGGRQIANTGVVTFPQNTGANEDQIGFGFYTASTAGTLRTIAFLDADPPVLGTANESDDTITAPAHGLSADQRVFVLAAPGALLPAGLSENTIYWVRSTGLTADAFTVSTTQGGAAVNITAKGASLFMPFTPVTVATGATPEFAASALVIQL